PITLIASYAGKTEDDFVIEFTWNDASIHFVDVLHAAGAIPLPPYIKRGAEAIDAVRYQTIFGKYDGSVAAPTAALHFTNAVFNKLKQNGVEKAFITLNVGAGTFKPVKSQSLAEHHMHGEDFTISKEVLEKIVNSKRIIAVGTTTLRTPESIHWLGVKLKKGTLKNDWVLGQWEAYGLDDAITYKESITAIIGWMKIRSLTELHCRTSLLIAPGYTFKIPAALITNFHQPRSTLLLLVAAFIGEDWKKIYEHALEKDYRFLSYGDSSLLWRKEMPAYR
ncbi:MAG: S-adenosylmethionine:tRNA ribosyltransferase-isomerase, partial [Bacteroidota bacterium]|nr:S-adenosylmethionine:tRNA ribosyltransferase-isomerase [Bacteroidota bacterium]